MICNGVGATAIRFASGGGGTTYDSFVFRTLDLGINVPVDLVPRDGARMVFLSNGAHLLGGWNTVYFAATNDSTNEHWFNATPDDPTTWTQLADAPFDGVHVFGLDVVNDVIYKYGNDVQNSGRTAYKYTIGVGWTLITADMGIVWGDRYICGYKYNPNDGYFYAVGGVTGLAGTYYSDVLRCTTLFTDWQIVGNLPDNGGGLYPYLAPCLEVIDDKLRLWGGGIYLSDIFNTNIFDIDNTGIPTIVGALPIAMQGTYTNSAVIGGTAFHVNGYKATGGNQRGMYYSNDKAITWTRLYDNPIATHASTIVGNGSNKAYWVTGNMYNYIYSIEGITTPTTEIPTGAEAIYSVFNDANFVGSYAMEVQRSSDNTTLDIGFIGNDIDEATMTTFMGVGDLYVSKWYDRSGNGKHAVNVLGSRPRIGLGGVLDKVNGKVAVYHTAGTQSLIFPSINLGKEHTVFGVLNLTTTDREFIGGAGNTYLMYRDAASTFANMGSAVGTNTDGTFSLNTQKLLTDYRKQRIYQRYFNGDISINSFSISAVNPDFIITNLSGESDPAYNFVGYMQFVAIYAGDKLPQKEGIETKINNYFSIY